MNELVKVLFYNWMDKQCSKGEEVTKALDEYRQILNNTCPCYESSNDLDDAVIGVCSAYERQGFTAGFETARQLLTGQHLPNILTGEGA